MLTLTAYDPNDSTNTYEWQDADDALANAFADKGPQPLAAYFPPIGAPAVADFDLSATVERLKAIASIWSGKENVAQEGPEHEIAVDLAKIQPLSVISYSTKNEGQYIKVLDGPAQQEKNPNFPRLKGLITFCEQTQEHQALLATENQ